MKQVLLHPQAALQLADHYTRSKYFNPPIKYICGVLYGISDGFKSEICSSEESLIIDDSDSMILDIDVFNNLKEYHMKNYKNEVPIGWYSCHKLKNEEINSLNSLFENNFDVHLRLEYNYYSESSFSVYGRIHGNAWEVLQFQFHSEHAENVGILQLQSDGNAENQVQFVRMALLSLDNSLSIIEEFLNKTLNKEIPFHHDLVRQCNDIIYYFAYNGTNHQDIRQIENAQLSLIVTNLAELTIAHLNKNKK